MNALRTRHDRCDSPEAGLSLVELMVALTLSLVLLAGVTTAALNAKQSDNELIRAGEQLENGRYALETMKNDLQHAGFFGELYRLPAVPAVPPSPCTTNPTELASALPLAIQGYDDANGLLPCISNAVAKTDLLVVRRADTRGIPLDAPIDDDDGDGDRDDLDFGRLYLQTRSDRYVLAYCTADSACTGVANCGGPLCADKLPGSRTRTVAGGKTEVFSLTRSDGITLAELRPYRVHVYYLRPWSGHTGDGIPALVRLELADGGSSPKLTSMPLVEGIERMAFQYGVDLDNPPDGSPDAYTAVPADTGEWSRVVAVRVNLLVRSLDQSLHYTGSGSFDLGEGEVVLPGSAGRYRRHVFGTGVWLGNPAGRRE
jgi:type IV pilus assembly protein PilW